MKSKKSKSNIILNPKLFWVPIKLVSYIEQGWLGLGSTISYFMLSQFQPSPRPLGLSWIFLVKFFWWKFCFKKILYFSNFFLTIFFFGKTFFGKFFLVKFYWRKKISENNFRKPFFFAIFFFSILFFFYLVYCLDILFNTTSAMHFSVSILVNVFYLFITSYIPILPR